MSQLGSVHTFQLASATILTTSVQYPMAVGPQTFQATIFTTSTGASAVINAACTVQFSNDNVGWVTAGTCSPTGTGTAADGFVSNAPWKMARTIITTLTTGVSAQMVVSMGS